MENKTTALVGTTLDVLQAYPLGSLEVEIIAGARKGERHIVIGLDCVENFGVICGGPFKRIATLHECCLPVLRHISQLVGQGNTATLELFELLEAFTGSPVERIELAAYGAAEPGEEPRLHVSFRQGGNRHALSQIRPSGAAMIAGELYTCADWLRSRGFAVGLEPSQYIAKEAGGAPTKEGRASHE